MQRSSIGTLVAVLGAGAAVLFLAPPAANSQIRANPSFQPIGASASGNTSTAWFHDPSTGRAIACQTVNTAGTGLTGLQCVAAKLPQDTP